MDRIYLLVVVIASVLLSHWVVARPFARLSFNQTEMARFALFSSIMAVPSGFLIGLVILWHKEWGPPQYFYLGIVWPACMGLATIVSFAYRDARSIAFSPVKPEVRLRAWLIVIRSFPILLVIGVVIYILAAQSIGVLHSVSTYVDN